MEGRVILFNRTLSPAMLQPWECMEVRCSLENFFLPMMPNSFLPSLPAHGATTCPNKPNQKTNGKPERLRNVTIRSVDG